MHWGVCLTVKDDLGKKGGQSEMKPSSLLSPQGKPCKQYFHSSGKKSWIKRELQLE